MLFAQYKPSYIRRMDTTLKTKGLLGDLVA